MKQYSLMLSYALRMVRGERSRYVLPFASLTLTALVASVIVLMTGSIEAYLMERNRDAVGGDVAIRGNFPLDEDLIRALEPYARSTREISFSGTLRGADEIASVSFRVVDDTFPLVGAVTLQGAVPYRPLSEDEILLDAGAMEKLRVGEGGTVFIGDVAYRVLGGIEKEPDALFGGFRFLPRVILSHKGLLRSGLSPELLRAEYRIAIVFGEAGYRVIPPSFIERATAGGYRVEVAGDTTGGILLGIGALERFLGIATLLVALLATVNVYVSACAIERRVKRTFAVLRALGAHSLMLLGTLALTFGITVLTSAVFGTIMGYGFSVGARFYIEGKFQVVLPHIVSFTDVGYILAVVCMSALVAAVPLVRMYRTAAPLALLRNEDTPVKKGVRAWESVIAFLGVSIPLAILAVVSLGSVTRGVLALAVIASVYLLVLVAYRFMLTFLYRIRTRFGFLTRTVIAEKYDDGLFGAISFGSLFIGLVSLSTLALTHASLTTFLDESLVETLPSLYVLDVQRSQYDDLIDAFPTLTLFPNVGARIGAIDGVQIQEALREEGTTVDRELSREFNITYRSNVLPSERIVEGVWRPEQGVLSVEEDFAKRAGIRLGSRVTLVVQGFEVEGVVESIRAADTRSGLPFFFLVGSPLDFEQFPVTYFGYMNGDKVEVDAVSAYVARTMPNVSVIPTDSLRALSRTIIDTLLLLSYVIALPSLALACLLIVALIVLSYEGRRRDGARLLALGMRARVVERLYLFETVSMTFVACIVAYGVAVGATAWLVRSVLEFETIILVDTEVLYALGALVGLVVLVGLLLWRSDRAPLQRTLAYEENY